MSITVICPQCTSTCLPFAHYNFYTISHTNFLLAVLPGFFFDITKICPVIVCVCAFTFSLITKHVRYDHREMCVSRYSITAAVLSLASCAAKKGCPPRNGDKHADRQCRTVHTPSPTTTKNIYRIRKHLSCGVQPKVRGREAVMRRYCVYNRLGMRECNSISARMNDGAEKKWCEETVNNVDLSPEAPSPLSLPPPHSLFTSLLATSTDLVRQFLPVVVLITQFIETDKS